MPALRAARRPAPHPSRGVSPAPSSPRSPRRHRGEPGAPAADPGCAGASLSLGQGTCCSGRNSPAYPPSRSLCRSRRAAPLRGCRTGRWEGTPSDRPVPLPSPGLQPRQQKLGGGSWGRFQSLGGDRDPPGRPQSPPFLLRCVKAPPQPCAGSKVLAGAGAGARDCCGDKRSRAREPGDSPVQSESRREERKSSAGAWGSGWFWGWFPAPRQLPAGLTLRSEPGTCLWDRRTGHPRGSGPSEPSGRPRSAGETGRGVKMPVWGPRSLRFLWLWAGGGARSRFLVVCSSRDGFHRSGTTRIAALGDELFPGEAGAGAGLWQMVVPVAQRLPGGPGQDRGGLWNAWRRWLG